jgi:Tol biopolymer transport system component
VEIFSVGESGERSLQLTQDSTESPDVSNIHPVCSSDGTWIAFTSIRVGQSDIFLMHPDGNGKVPLTDEQADDADATFSPDSRQIAFVSQRDGRGSIYMMNLDGTILGSLADLPGSISSLAWSPDGSRIAFYSYREGYVSGIFRTPTDGSGQIGMQIALAPRTLEATNPCWLPANYEAVGQQGGVGSTERVVGTIIAACLADHR